MMKEESNLKPHMVLTLYYVLSIRKIVLCLIEILSVMEKEPFLYYFSEGSKLKISFKS